MCSAALRTASAQPCALFQRSLLAAWYLQPVLHECSSCAGTERLKGWLFACLPDCRVARKVMAGGKPALTEFTVLASAPGAALAAAGAAVPCSDTALAAAVAGGGLSLIRCRPQTGRTHQVGRGLLGKAAALFWRSFKRTAGHVWQPGCPESCC